ncbi:Crp/Fnr family transcriptional regulator [Chloroflexota bacterium]
MAALEEFLQDTAYFVGLSAAEITAFGKSFFSKDAARGEIVLFEGEPAQVLCFVVFGVVKVFKTSAEGKEQILELVRPGESCNDVPVFGNGKNLSSAEALGPVVLYGIKKPDLEIISHDYPVVAQNIIRVLSTKVERLVALIEDLSFKNVTGRVAKILLEHVGDDGSAHRLTQQEMAAMAGTAREMVGRSLKALEENRAIRLEHHRIVIKNKELLAEIAGVIS